MKGILLVGLGGFLGAIARYKIGGLVLLLVTLQRRRALHDAVGGATVVSRFSTMAFWSVVVLSVAWADAPVANRLAVRPKAIDTRAFFMLVCSPNSSA